jgi:hypothetical protein
MQYKYSPVPAVSPQKCRLDPVQAETISPIPAASPSEMKVWPRVEATPAALVENPIAGYGSAATTTHRFQRPLLRNVGLAPC